MYRHMVCDDVLDVQKEVLSLSVSCAGKFENSRICDLIITCYHE